MAGDADEGKRLHAAGGTVDRLVPSSPSESEVNEALERRVQHLTAANRRLMLLNRVATSLLHDESRERLREMFEAVAGDLEARYYFHYRTDDNRPGILSLASAGGFDADQEASIWQIEFGGGGQMTSPRDPLILEKIHLRDDEMTAGLRALGIRAYVGLPLISHGHLFGTIAFAATERDSFGAADVELVRTLAYHFAAVLDRQRLVQQLRDSENLYRGAVITGRLASWETNMVTGERIWTEEGMAMFGLDLPNGRGRVGGENDEYWRTLHPEDRHKVAEFWQTADEVDSYPAEYRIVRSDGKMLWMSGRGRVIERGPDGKARRVANIVTDVTDRKKGEEHMKLLIDELNHRVKNTLATVQAIINQTLKNASDVEDIREAVESRLQALSGSHDLLTRENWEGAQLRRVVEQALQPFSRGDGDRHAEIEGINVRLRPKAALSLGMALHELATNAAKYGALSVPGGNVRISWTLEPSATGNRLRLIWLERGGPPVTRPLRKGFGSRLIERGLAYELEGEVELNFKREGLCCTIDLPVADAGGEA